MYHDNDDIIIPTDRYMIRLTIFSWNYYEQKKHFKNAYYLLFTVQVLLLFNLFNKHINLK